VQVLVNPLPNGTITSSSAAICEYESADMVFTASAGSPLYHIEYTVTAPSGAQFPRTASNLTSGAVIPVVAVNSAPGNYIINFNSITDKNGNPTNGVGCTRTTGLSNLTVRVKPTPNVIVTAIPPICEGDSATLVGNNADSYAWSGPALSTNSGNNIKASPASTSGYTITGTTEGCSASRPFSITVNPRPDVNIGVQDNNICLNDQGIFTVNSATIDSGSIQNFYWDFDNGVTLVNPGTVTTTNPQSYGTHRVYVVKLYALSDKNCASVTDTAHIAVNPLPVAKFDVPAFVCLPNNSATFVNQSTIPDGTRMDYTWNFGDIGSSSNTSTNTNGSHIYPDSANYHVTLSVVSAAGCTADTSRDFAAFFRKPVASFDVTPDTLCQGSPNVFTDYSFAPGSNITSRLWNFGDGTTLNDSVNAVKTYTRPGTFKVTLVAQNTQGCTSDVFEQMVKVYLQPVIDAGPSFVVPAGTLISFNATANSNSLQLAWTSPTGGTVSNPAVLKPQYLANQDGKFILTATGDGNCKASDSLTVKVLKPIGIPNAFSPNGDNINDKWNITNLADYPSCVVEVFNRYGQPVFRSFGYQQPWDGSYKGKILPVGTYYYIIEPKNGFPRITGYVVIVK
jgi:gliding motility-associated-like protein